MVHLVAVDDPAAQIPDGLQRAGLTGAGTAGDADDHPLLSSGDGLEARRLLQPVADGKAKALTVRALGIDLSRVLAVRCV